MSYDAEDDIGLVAENPAIEVAVRNTQLLSAALEAQHALGAFQFRDGKTGPVLHPITASGREFYFAGTITTSKRTGGALAGCGGRVPHVPSASYNHVDGRGGLVTRFTRIDGEQGGAVIRLRGTQFNLSGIEFRGRRYDYDPTGEGPRGGKAEPKGTSTPVGIEIEGRQGYSTGWHNITNCSVFYCGQGVKLAPGYWGEDGKFVREEIHAEAGVLAGVTFVGCDSCIRLENQQAVNWSFRDIEVNGPGGEGLQPTIVFDCERANNLWAENIGINHQKSTLVRVKGYSQFANRIDIRNVKWDRGMGLVPGGYAKIFECDPATNDPAFRWCVRVTGHIAGDDVGADFSKLIDVPAKCPVEDILLDIEGLPKGRFTPVPSGPWVRPNRD